jgi:hypothetical protein
VVGRGGGLIGLCQCIRVLLFITYYVNLYSKVVEEET